MVEWLGRGVIVSNPNQPFGIHKCNTSGCKSEATNLMSLQFIN